MKKFNIEDFSVAFGAVNDSGLDLVIVGGQACSFYGAYYVDRSPILQSLFPFTSKDIDFFGGETEALILAHAIGGKFTKSPQAGGMRGMIIGKITSGDLLIEILGHVKGLTERDVRREVLRGKCKGATITVLNPIALYEAKAANLMEIDQTNRQDAKHLQIMEAVAPLFLSDVASDLKPQGESALGNALSQNTLKALNRRFF